jgi:hypothetical protein
MQIGGWHDLPDASRDGCGAREGTSGSVSFPTTIDPREAVPNFVDGIEFRPVKQKWHIRGNAKQSVGEVRSRMKFGNEEIYMDLNKKQKKQLDTARKKLTALKQQLAGARKQPDSPDEIPRLEKEIAKVEAEIKAIQGE